MGILDENLKHFPHRRARRTSSSPLFLLAMRGEFFLFLSVTRKCFIWCQGGSFVLCCQSKRFLESDWGGEGERERERRSDERALGATVSLSDSQGADP